jgi:Rrf2 family transcriptional regulator, cysteine metabolism repressor
MNFTSRSRYALKIMMDLTRHSVDPLVRRNDIAARQGVPSDYLDQIMIRLRAGGLVESIRGRNGGYRLARKPQEISLWNIFSAVEDSIYPAECLGENSQCGFEAECVAFSVWEEIFTAVRAPLETMTLQSICERWQTEFPVTLHHGVRECRPGKSDITRNYGEIQKLS